MCTLQYSQQTWKSTWKVVRNNANWRLKFFKNIWNASECRRSILGEYSNFTCCHLSLNYFRKPSHAWLRAVYTGGSASMVFNDGIRGEERGGINYHFRICDCQQNYISKCEVRYNKIFITWKAIEDEKVFQPPEFPGL